MTSNYREIEGHLSHREAFQGNSASGTRVASTSFSHLPSNLREEYDGAAREGRIEYTVLSYYTPVAWVTTDGVVRIPNVSYSRTTSRLQSLCRSYLARGLTVDVSA